MNDNGHHLSRGSGNDPWRIIGVVLAVVAVITGLVIVGTFIFVLIALNSWGSNK